MLNVKKESIEFLGLMLAIIGGIVLIQNWFACGTCMTCYPPPDAQYIIGHYIGAMLVMVGVISCTNSWIPSNDEVLPRASDEAKPL